MAATPTDLTAVDVVARPDPDVTAHPRLRITRGLRGLAAAIGVVTASLWISAPPAAAQTPDAASADEASEPDPFESYCRQMRRLHARVADRGEPDLAGALLPTIDALIARYCR